MVLSVCMAARGELISELQRLAGELGETPTATEKRELDGFNPYHYQKEFGTWNEAIEAAGLSINQNRATNAAVADFIKDLQQVAGKAGRVPRRSDAKQYGKWNTTTYQERVPDNGEKSNWNEVLKEAGFEPYYKVRNTITKECKNCGDKFQLKAYRSDRQFCDMDCYTEWREGRFTGENSYSYNRIEVNCAACNNTLKRIKSHDNRRQHHFCNNNCYAQWISENKNGEDAFHWQGGPATYGPGWDREKKKEVRKRDDYRCQACGKTQKQELDDIGRNLCVHHIIPAKQFDNSNKRNDKNNLVTLCLSCHMKWEGIPLKPQFSD